MKNSSFMQRLLASYLFSNLRCLELEHKPKICWNFFTTVVSSCWNVQFMDGLGLSWRNRHHYQYENSHTNNDTSVIWFGSERAQSKHQWSAVTSFKFEAKSQEPHKLWEGVFKPDSTDEDSPPNLSIGQRVVVPCGADIVCIGWNTMWCKRVSCTGSGQML